MKRMHQLKTWPAPFAALWDGKKRHEVRKDDRGFAVGDLLKLTEYDPREGGYYGQYTMRAICAVVTYKTEGGTWGLPAGLCVLSIEELGRTEADAIGVFDRYQNDTATKESVR